MNNNWKSSTLGKRKWHTNDENSQGGIHEKLDLLLERVEEVLDLLQEIDEQEDCIDYQSDPEVLDLS